MLSRFYLIPGLLLSLLMSVSPSFRFSAMLLRLFGNSIGRNVCIHSGVRLLLPSRISVGENSTVNSGCLIDPRCGVSVGKNTMIGREVKIFTLGHDVHSPTFESVGGSVTIGDNAVIFPYCLIMPGVVIGDNSVVYTGSVVTKSIGPGEVVGGNPARYIKDRNCEVGYSLNYKCYFGV